MKIFKALSAFFCSSILILSSFSFAGAEENKPESLTIIGDSISSGYGLDGYVSGDNYSAENYGRMLCDQYEIADENYYNYAVDGETTKGLLAKLETGQYDEGISASEVIIISIGGNDLLDVIIGDNSAVFKDTELKGFLNGEVNIAELLKDVDLKELAAQITEDAQKELVIFYQNMPKIAKYITDKNPDALVIIQTLYNPMKSGITIIDDLYDSTISSLNFGIDGMDGCVISDVYSAFKESDKKLIQKDFTHPNEEGHKVIFETLKETITLNFKRTINQDINDEPASTQPITTTTTTAETTTTTTVTTTVIETTTTPPVTTTVVTASDIVTTTSTKEIDNDNDKRIAVIVVPIVLSAIGIMAVFGIVSINKNRKN